MVADVYSTGGRVQGAGSDKHFPRCMRVSVTMPMTASGERRRGDESECQCGGREEQCLVHVFLLEIVTGRGPVPSHENDSITGTFRSPGGASAFRAMRR